MPIAVLCDCGTVSHAEDDAAGKKIRCPACFQLVPVPYQDLIGALGLDLIDESSSKSPRPISRLSAAKRRAKPVKLIAAGAVFVAVAFAGFSLFRPVDDPFFGIPPDAILSDEEASRYLELSLDRWTKASDKLRSDETNTEAARALSHRRGLEFEALLDRVSVRYRPQLLELARYFEDDSGHIFLDVESTKGMLANHGIKVEISELLDGALRVMRHSRNPRKSQGVRSFDSLYQSWREEGKTHEWIINRMIEYKKI